ncbi:ABC transporter substrate-binding protein [Enterovirga sp. DB1703]|uniref:ABC transporter substrate-binding protein n=1 Tax=Enterovirga aerilata TaxID=2730920 RepID=A0A849IA01_9HYPH|nr:ABC transporter substrate-binding protein [Enterovirga sp. DB1703]
MRRESWLLLVTLAFVAAAIAFWLTRATVLTVGVAPSGGTEPALLRAYAETSVTRRSGIRLEIVRFDGVRESAEALAAGKVDLAVVRPDIAMPPNGLTLAVLRELAVILAIKEGGPVRGFSDLGGRRLGMLAERISDRPLVAALLERYGLELRPDAASAAVPEEAVALVPLAEEELGPALAAGRVDAAMLVTTPASPGARRLVKLLDEAAGDRSLLLLGIPDAAAVVATSPKLQAVTVPAGLFGGDPRLPEEDLSTVGSSYRLMARASLSRSVAAEVTQHIFEHRADVAARAPAADDITFPAYDTTAVATTARLPNHPGAIDYFEREQESFIERYESWIYLVAIFGGGLGSAFAWLRQTLFRIRRERIQVATARLLAIRSEATRVSDPERLRSIADEVDSIAANIARQALNRRADWRLVEAASIAIDAARSTLARALAAARR